MRVKLHKQSGISLVLALFILVVLSMLGAAMMNLLSVNSDSVAREVASTRALMAANSGAERNLSAILPPGGATNTSQCVAASTSYGAMGLMGCSDVSVTCELTTEAGVNYFMITSTGSCGPSGDEATRVVRVQAKD